MTTFDNSVKGIEGSQEFFHYEDTGCEISTSCLTCPLPQCKYDDPVWFQKCQRLAKDLKVIRAMQKEDLSVEAAALKFDVTVRTIFRIMRRFKDSNLDVDPKELEIFAATV